MTALDQLIDTYAMSRDEAEAFAFFEERISGPAHVIFMLHDCYGVPDLAPNVPTAAAAAWRAIQWAHSDFPNHLESGAPSSGMAQDLVDEAVSNANEQMAAYAANFFAPRRSRCDCLSHAEKGERSA